MEGGIYIELFIYIYTKRVHHMKWYAIYCKHLGDTQVWMHDGIYRYRMIAHDWYINHNEKISVNS